LNQRLLALCQKPNNDFKRDFYSYNCAENGDLDTMDAHEIVKDVRKTLMILNAEFGGNKGAEAMLVTTIDSMYNSGFRGRIYVEKPQNSPVAYCKSMCQKFEKPGLKIDTFIFRPKRIVENILFGYRNNNGEKINPDFVIDIGGLAFCDKSLIGSLRTWFRYLPLQLRRVPYVFFIQDFGPMRKLSTRTIAWLTLILAKKIFTRSAFSRDELLTTLPAIQSRVLGPFPDMTVVLKPSETNSATAVVNSEYLIICPSVIIWKSYGQKYIEVLKSIADKYREQYQILILVHTFYHKEGDSDKFVAEMLLKEIPGSHIFSENIDTREIKKIIADSVFVFTSRYHALVAGLSSGVPSFAIGWNEKYQSFLEYYCLPECSLDMSSTNQILEFDFNKYLNANTRGSLRTITSDMKASVTSCFDILMNMIRAL
jgi:colanic acid/amylovoran biosynthesis protein